MTLILYADLHGFFCCLKTVCASASYVLKNIIHHIKFTVMIRSSILFLGFLFLISCSQTASEKSTAQAKLTSQTEVNIPKLLDRSEKLRYGKEWDEVQNYYGAQSAELRRHPENPDARLKLAELFIQEARITGEHPHYYPAALQMLEPVIKSLENNTNPSQQQKDHLFRALSHQAGVELSLHDFAKARRTAERAVVINPYNAYIYGCLVDANVELGDYAKAVEMCDKMVGIRPDLRSYSRVSYLREIHGETAGAIEAMDMAVKAGYPGYEQTEWARLQLGHLHERYGKMADAEKQYQMCLAARDNYPFAIAALAGLEEKRGNYAKAETLLKQAADIIPEVGFYVDLVKIYQKTGREAEAKPLIKDIQEMLNEDMAAGHNMSMEAARFQLEVTKDFGKALQLAQEEYQKRPKNKDINQLLAGIYLAQGDKKQAAEHLKKAGVTGSKDPELLKMRLDL